TNSGARLHCRHRASPLSFSAGRLLRLPLHVRRDVGAAALRRDNVVDDVALPVVRVAGLAFERRPLLRVRLIRPCLSRRQLLQRLGAERSYAATDVPSFFLCSFAWVVFAFFSEDDF